MSENLLMDHQKKTIDYGLRHPYFIMGLEPGLGKTICALLIAIQSKKKRNLIVCPAGVRLTSKREIKKWFPDMRISVFFNKNDLYELWDTDFAIISYEMLKYSDYLFEWAQNIIVDEAHYLKNSKAGRTDFMHRRVFENETDRLMLLTGTPIVNNVVEFYSLMALAYYNPRIEEPRFLKKFPTDIDFALHFSNKIEFTVNGEKRIKFKGVKNELELKEYLKPIYIRFEADKVLDLPKKIEKDILIDEMDNPALLAEFDKFRESDLGDSVKSSAKKQAAIAMAPFTIEYVKMLLIGGVDKVVVFSDHIESANIIAEAFGVRAMTSEMTKGEDRDRTINNFQVFDTPQVIVGTTKVMGTVYTLTRSNNLVINDPPWVPGDLDQLMRRIIRICQKKVPIIHHMLGSFQAEYIMNVLKEKIADIRKVV